jgi:hypothetical protein
MMRVAVRTLTCLACLCCLVAVTGCESTADRVEINAQSLQSDATDGAVLAGEIVAGRAGATFARAHAQELQDDTTQIEKNVYDQKLPNADQLQKLADQIGTALGTIAVQADDVQIARQSRDTLLRLADDASKLTS